METIRKYRSSLAAILLLLASATPLAAQDAEELFADDFSFLDAAFGDASDSLGVKDGSLFVKLDKNQWWRPFYQSMVFEDIDLTVKVQMPDMAAEQGAGIGVMFWGMSADNMYLFEISDSGTFSVRRFTPTRVLLPVFWRTTEAINSEPGEWNELRVVMRGRYATLYINGKEQAKIKGRPPEGGSLVGLFFETGADAADEGSFSELKVVAPTGDAPADDDPTMLLNDDFTTLDPAWGSETEALHVADGKLLITPTVNMTWTKFWEGDVFTGDFDASLKLHVIQKDPEKFPLGALAFWGVNWDDYWAFYVMPDGSMGVIHWVKTRWLYPMKAKMVPAEAKFDPNGMTELRVVTEGRKATFFVNGVNVGTVSGMPPKDGGYIGMYNEASAAGGAIEYDDLVVKAK